MESRLGVAQGEAGVVESLEARLLLSGTVSPQESIAMAPSGTMLGQGGFTVGGDGSVTDRAGNVFFMDPAVDPEVQPQESQASNPIDWPPFALSQTFLLHSNPGASKVVYLDFDGNTTSGTYWYGGGTFTTPAYSFEGDSSFSTNEQTRIQLIWARVAEDYLPFDVDVTTQDPGVEALRNTGGTDTQWGIRVVIGGSSYDWYGASAGGVAYVGSFTWGSDTPCFVFPNQLGSGAEKYVAEAATHEAGHTVGLYHDGDNTTGYYQGHGSGDVGWAPIMGVGYYKYLVQWSKGEYPNANNHEDDLAIVTSQNGFGYRADDCGSTLGTAGALGVAGGTVYQEGIIERTTDIDCFHFATGAGSISLSINPSPVAPDLDIQAILYDAAGNQVAASNPADHLYASLSLSLPAGSYTLAIQGVGAGDLTTGYSDYGSLGYYVITGTIIDTQLDFGDAPSPYPTTLAGNGARHQIVPAGPVLGMGITAETDGQPSSMANADAEDNGINFQTILMQDYSAQIRVFVGQGGGAFLNAWIDFNGDGDWLDAGEQIVTNFTVALGANILTFSVPPSGVSVAGYTFARFRLSTVSGLAPTGYAADGEVEDYRVQVFPQMDFGDAPDAPYPTLLASNGARHGVIPGGPVMGMSVEPEPDGQPGPTATNDLDENGVTFVNTLTQGQQATVRVFLGQGANALLNAWIDFNADGDWADPGEQIFTDRLLAVGYNNLLFTVPSDAAAKSTYARFRVSTVAGLSCTGYARDGEVEDRRVSIASSVSTAPGAPDLLSDTGADPADDLTDLDNGTPLKALQFLVAATSGATVVLYADGVAIGSALADSSGAAITTTGAYDLADGDHNITARQTVPGKTESPDSPPLLLHVDTAAPAVSVTPRAGNNRSPALSGDISPADPAASVSVSVNGAAYAALVAGSSWSLPAGALPPLPVGLYDVQVLLTDAAGNTSSDSSTGELIVYALPGDLNLDDSVDLQDFSLLKDGFGLSNVGYLHGDINLDGTVDLQDFSLLKDNFGQTPSFLPPAQPLTASHTPSSPAAAASAPTLWDSIESLSVPLDLAVPSWI